MQDTGPTEQSLDTSGPDQTKPGNLNNKCEHTLKISNINQGSDDLR